TVLGSVLLTRLYSPEAFGALAVFLSLVFALAPMSTLRFNQAIPISRSPAEATRLFAICLYFSLVLAIVVLLLSPTDLFHSLLGLVDAAGIAPYGWLLAVAVFLLATYETLVYWAINLKLFTGIAHTRITRAVLTV